MIRYLTAAFIFIALPAMAQSQSEIEATEGFIHAAFARLYCGLAIPDIIEMELNQIADKNGWNRTEFAASVVLYANEKGKDMTIRQRDAQCALTLKTYRALGLQR